MVNFNRLVRTDWGVLLELEEPRGCHVASLAANVILMSVSHSAALSPLKPHYDYVVDEETVFDLGMGSFDWFVLTRQYSLGGGSLGQAPG